MRNSYFVVQVESTPGIIWSSGSASFHSI